MVKEDEHEKDLESLQVPHGSIQLYYDPKPKAQS